MKLPLRSLISVPPPTNLVPITTWDGLLDLFASRDEANFNVAMELFYSMDLHLPHKSWVVLYYAAAAQYQRFGRYDRIAWHLPESEFWKKKGVTTDRAFYIGGHWYHEYNPEIVLIANAEFRREIKFTPKTRHKRLLWMLLERHGTRFLQAVEEIFDYAEKNRPCTTK